MTIDPHNLPKSTHAVPPANTPATAPTQPSAGQAPAADPSNRPSDRVDGPTRPAPVLPAARPVTGPESMTPSRWSASAAEGQAVRRGRHQLEAIRRALSDRDWRVLRALDQYRYLTTAHVQQLCFDDHLTDDAAGRACRRVLARLAASRVVEHLERRIGGVRAGSQSYVWRVGVLGDRLLRAGSSAPRDRRREPSLHFLDHVLAVADCAALLTTASPARDWRLETVTTEPQTWRRYLGAHGALNVLKPDLYVRTTSGAYEDHWYLEIDRATESLPVVVRQCERYEAYRATGRAQAELDVFPLVVWLTPDRSRARKIERAIQTADGLHPALYRVAPQTEVVSVISQAATP